MIKLISMTQPADGITPQELLAHIARVSNPKNQDNHATAPKLLRYLIKHGHWSPFEMVDATYEIITSRAIAAQIIRHRSFSFQEFSQRYSNVPGVEQIQLRAQADSNRQSSSEVMFDLELYSIANEAIEACKIAYDKLLSKGVARECARMIMPLASTSRLYMKGSLRSWIHYTQLRTQDDTQKEHREIALRIQSDLSQRFPSVWEALNESV